MKCKFCESEKRTKAGVTRGKQRWLCGSCGRHYTLPEGTRGRPLADKKKAVALYAAGLSYRAIGTLLEVSHVSVQKWLERYIPEWCPLPAPESQRPVILELDEMWHFLQKKPKSCGSGRPSTNSLVGLSDGYVVIAMPRH